MTPFAALSTGAAELAMAMSLPIALAPISSPFLPLSDFGRRLVLAVDGVYMEGNSPALYARVRIAEGSLPYGTLPSEGAIKVHAGPVPRAFFEKAMDRAHEAHPKEMALLAVRRGDTHELVEPRQVGDVAAVRYDDTAIDETTLVLDMHSHGPYKAEFSITDDASDRSRVGPHIAIVYGRCETRQSMTMTARVCVGGHFVELSQADLRAVIS